MGAQGGEDTKIEGPEESEEMEEWGVDETHRYRGESSTK